MTADKNDAGTTATQARDEILSKAQGPADMAHIMRRFRSRIDRAVRIKGAATFMFYFKDHSFIKLQFVDDIGLNYELGMWVFENPPLH